jgi:uncharacterized protein (TIGR02231 family)
MMTTTATRLLPVVLLALSLQAAVLKPVHSTISAVTVYADRAQVVRTYTEALSAGEHRLLFDSLPDVIEGNSILANGSGPAILKDVKYRVERFAENTDSLGKALGEAKTALEDTIGMADDRMGHAASEKTFVENIVKKLVGTDKDSAVLPLDPDKWVKMVGFYRAKLDSLDREVRLTEKGKRAVSARLQKINDQLGDVGKGESKSRHQVEVVVEMKEAGRLTIDLSYIVYGPSWSPAYDLRVLTSGKKMNLTYYGIVRQSTTENWDDVQLRLSTARPQIGGQQPELSPWYVGFDTYPESRDDEERSEKRKASTMMANQMMAKEAAPEMALAPPPPAPIERPTASVETGATSVVFAIPGKNTVASDNVEHKVAVMVTDFAVEFRYSTVPKLSPYAYLKAKAKNNTAFPLLPGPTSIFLDNSYVAAGTLGLVAPLEEFWTFLGVDEAMKVERKLVNRFEKNEGVLGRRQKVTYEYLITITNNRKSEEEIVVWDQLPISNNQEIKVELLDPKYKEDSPGLKKNEMQFFEWYFKPKPGEEIKIPFKFSVEYPADRAVSGL